jgi:hypothetical protein
MRRSSKELPRDPNQLAYEIVKLSTDDKLVERSEISEYLSRIGRKGGLKGGKARATKLSPSRRREIARKAANKRWRNNKS